MTVIRLPNGFSPRPYQRAAMEYFDRGGRRAITVWSRRAGKDLTALHQTCKMAHLRKGNYWHVFPTETQGRKALWEGFTRDGHRIMEQVFPTAIRKSPREWRPGGEMVVELKCGSIWRLLGSDKMEVVGAGIAGAVFSEFALAKPNTWDLIRPMLQESGGWAWMITTPRGNNHAKKLYDMAQSNPDWYHDLRTLHDIGGYGNGLSPAAVIQEERSSGMPEALIQQEYLCDWTAANVGSYYGALIQALELTGRIGAFAHGTSDVFTSWDLGHDDSTAIWFWRLAPGRDGVDFLDHYESRGKPMSHYFDLVEEWALRRGYRYARHWLPHDARAKTLQTGASILDQCRDRWTAGKVAITPQLSVQDGIQAGRWLLQQETRFHERCRTLNANEDTDGIEALKAYHAGWNDERKVLSVEPVHDWSSHTADAFRYVACVVKVSEMLTRPPPAERQPDFGNPNVIVPAWPEASAGHVEHL